MKFEAIIKKGEYALIHRGKDFYEYAVVWGWDDESWSRTIRYWSFKENPNFTEAECLAKALDCFRCKTENDYISRSRLEEIATASIYGLIEDDRESAMEFFSDTLELNSVERDYFEITNDNMEGENEI